MSKSLALLLLLSARRSSSKIPEKASLGCEGPRSLEEASGDNVADIAISRALLDFPARARRFPDEDSLRMAFPRNDERRFCVLLSAVVGQPRFRASPETAESIHQRSSLASCTVISITCIADADVALTLRDREKTCCSLRKRPLHVLLESSIPSISAFLRYLRLRTYRSADVVRRRRASTTTE